MAKEELPMIRLALGDDFATVQSRSTYEFGRREISDTDLIATNTPLVFQYARPKCQFTLPPALFVGLGLDYAHVVFARVSPHLRYLTMDESLQLLDGLGDTLRRAEWRQVSREYASGEELRREFADPTADRQLVVGVGRWECEGDEIYITLERSRQREEQTVAPIRANAYASLLLSWGGRQTVVPEGNEDLFTTTVKIDNEEILRHYSDKVTEKPGGKK